MPIHDPAPPPPPPPPEQVAPSPTPQAPPVQPMEIVAGRTEVDVSDTSRSTVLTKDFLERVPTGRSYQNSVQMTAGVSGGANPNMAGGASNENTYMLDGQNIHDEVEGVVGGVPGGVVGGVVGGVLGGSMGGVAEGEPVPDSFRSASGVVDSDANDDWGGDEELEEEEAELYEVEATSMSVESRRSSVRLPKLPKVGGKKKKESREAYAEIEFDEVEVQGELVKPEGALLLNRRKASFGGSKDRERANEAPAYVPAETIEIAMGGEDEPPDVKATSLDVIVPEQGETVRYQHLLVPAGDAVTVPIHTRPQRSRRNR